MKTEERLSDHDLDIAIARQWMGYREVVDTTVDYHHVRHGTTFLLPPGLVEPPHLPPSGPIPYGYFVGTRWSTDMNEAMRLVKHLSRHGYTFVGRWESGATNFVAHFYDPERRVPEYESVAGDISPARAICEAAYGLQREVSL
jgi:hypothetical protein